MSAEQTASNRAGLEWFKSSHSGSGGGDCVEVATSAATVHVRDSKDTGGPVLRFSPSEWAAFVNCAKTETFRER